MVEPVEPQPDSAPPVPRAPADRSQSRSIYYASILALAVFALDQATKALVRSAVPEGGSVTIIPGIFRISHVRNTGAAFGILPEQQLFLLIASAAAIVLILLYVARVSSWSPLAALALGLELGGAAGNLIDRFTTGTVTDFLDFRIWPVFNVADSAIVVGAFLLLLVLLRSGRLLRSG